MERGCCYAYNNCRLLCITMRTHVSCMQPLCITELSVNKANPPPSCFAPFVLSPFSLVHYQVLLHINNTYAHTGKSKAALDMNFYEVVVCYAHFASSIICYKTASSGWSVYTWSADEFARPYMQTCTHAFITYMQTCTCMHSLYVHSVWCWYHMTCFCAPWAGRHSVSCNSYLKLDGQNIWLRLLDQQIWRRFLAGFLVSVYMYIYACIY